MQDVTTPLLPIKAEEDAVHEFDGASFSGAVFNLSTTIVGAGIMALPASIKMLGLIPGILMIILVALLTEASIDMLVRCSHQGKITSYGWLMGDTFGQWGRIALQASVVINNVGVLIVYMIIIVITSITSKKGLPPSARFESRSLIAYDREGPTLPQTHESGSPLAFL
ncbi:unnamed protein product [Miscanthus lutarioriparius]|uniref:Amino acid transporter transmembrane domain-containing protein n=1 Tax=Miscanthus lutarioriparius TaxID=422564 RepID=A0A811PK15_9POAL|nr:unnamed protein product [Miscanthus lutarioriparius]